MNQDLEHDKYVLPDELKDQLSVNLNGMGAGDKGYSRIKTILDDGYLGTIMKMCVGMICYHL